MKGVIGYVVFGILAVGAVAWAVYIAREQPYVADPNSLSMKYNIAKGNADLLFQQGNYGAAVQAYKNALALQPDNAQGHNDLGAAYYNKGLRLMAPPVEENLREYSPNSRDIVDYIDQRLKEVPSGKFVWSVPESVLEPLNAYVRKRGDIFYHAEREEPGFYEVVLINGATRKAFLEAEVEFRRALDIHSDFTPAKRNLGALYVMRGRTQDAIPLFEDVLKREPNDRDLRHYLDQLRLR